jgi:predicted sulfurtransferase
MPMSIIILFYKYVEIPNAQELVYWQRKLCIKLGLKGRIIIAHEGINGTLGGSVDAINSYKNSMLAHPLFAEIDFKESPGSDEVFPRLRIVVKKEIVNLGIDPSQLSARNAGTYVTPAQAHELLTHKPKDLVILDCRNKAESNVGTFVGAVPSNTTYFREFPEFVDKNVDLFKDKQVLMYCTGGVRCERGSAYLKSKEVAKEVYHIKGGIHRYLEQFPDGHFRGKNYVFDARLTVAGNAEILGNCLLCHQACDEYTNCINAACNKHFICCGSCLNLYQNACGSICHELVYVQGMPKRPMREKIARSCQV